MRKSTLRIKYPKRSRCYVVVLRSWFPPNDIFATTIARLCILREDLFLELHGIVKNPMKHLDSNSKAWRHNYFFRNSARTLVEISSALQGLKSIREFKMALASSPIEMRQFFQKYSTKFKNARELVKSFRNNLGGHVNQTTIQRALVRMESDRSSFFERSDPFNTHHRFVNDIFISALHVGDPERSLPEKDINEVLNLPRVMADLTAAILLIDCIFVLYAKHRGLIEP